MRNGIAAVPCRSTVYLLGSLARDGRARPGGDRQRRVAVVAAGRASCAHTEMESGAIPAGHRNRHGAARYGFDLLREGVVGVDRLVGLALGLEPGHPRV